MFEELGISGGTAIVVLIALYFIIKSAVKNGIKAAYRDITGKKAVSDMKTEQKLKEAGSCMFYRQYSASVRQSSQNRAPLQAPPLP